MPEDERWRLYESWAKIYDDDLKLQLQEAAEALEKKRKELQVSRSPRNGFCNYRSHWD